MELYTDEYYMQQAYKEALKAQEIDEIPIGAVVWSSLTIVPLMRKC